MSNSKTDSTTHSERICRLQLGNLQELIELENACFPHPYSVDQLSSLLTDPNSISAGILLGSDLIGYLFSRNVLQSLDIERIAVSPGQRRKGFSSELIHFAERKCQDLNINNLTLEVSSLNEGAIAFYCSLGFEVDGKRAAYYKDGSDAVLMSKKIA